LKKKKNEEKIEDKATVKENLGKKEESTKKKYVKKKQ